MKKCNNFYNLIIALFSVFFLMSGCGRGLNSPESPSPGEEARLFEIPKRLISNYGNMKESETVSWYWIKPGFEIDSSRSVKLHPLKNFTSREHTESEESIQSVLKEIFRPNQKRSESGMDIGMMAAIVDLKLKKGLIERFTSSIERNPFIEIELIIIDENSQKPLLKLAHFKKAEELEQALHGLTNDLKEFFQTRISKPADKEPRKEEEME